MFRGQRPWFALICCMSAILISLMSANCEDDKPSGPSDQCLIEVTSPNGGESWTEASVQDIRWNYTGECGENVKIELFRNGSLCATIATSEANDGRYTWTAVKCGDATDHYRVKVTDLATGASDQSDAEFEIPGAGDPCAVTVTAPNGGESWTEDTVQEITWTSTGDCGPQVSIELLRDGQPCATIVAVAANDGQYSWTAEQCSDSTGRYRVRVTDLTSGANDESDHEFEIPDPGGACAIEVTSPAGGTSWPAGTSQDIIWTSTGSCGAEVMIDLLRSGVVCLSIAASEPNDGQFTWAAEQCSDSTEHYQIRVTDATSGAADTNDGEFSIPDPCSVTVTSPNGGEEWIVGNTYPIEWTADCATNVRIELWRSGALCETIAASTPNDGAYTWQATQCDAASSDYAVRVVDLENGAADASGGSFSILECVIAVTAPDGGEVWTEGTSQDVTWIPSVDCGAQVKIELLRLGAVCATLAASTENDGSYAWTVTQCLDSTDGYAIRVTDLTTEADDESDAAFTIADAEVPCAIEVTAPIGGEVWVEGTVHDITWAFAGECGATVKIELLRDGAVCETIAESEANDGQYEWTATQCEDATDGYRIRVTDPTSGESDESDALFTVEEAIVPCVVTLTSPNGDESWIEGTVHDITWDSSGDCGETVKIELIREGLVCATIAESEANDGHYSWTSAQCDGETDGYRIRVTDPTSEASDESDGDLVIAPGCSIAVTSPNGGEIWTEETVHDIRWVWAGDCGQDLIIELVRDGAVCDTIAQGLVNDGHYAWTVSQCGSAVDLYHVRVTAPASGVTDQSDGAFTIEDAAVPCEMQVTSPNGGESWIEGAVHAITWTATGDCGDVVGIELLRDGVMCATIADSTENDGSYSWTAAQCDDATASYRVRITDLESDTGDESDSDFAIEEAGVPCVVTVTSPDGGETWTENTTQIITWSSTGDCGPNVKLELLRNGTVCETIAASVANDGEYSWMAQQCDGATDLYRVRVTDPTTGASDESDSDFMIEDAVSPCVVTLTSPNGGESWVEGALHSITWGSTGDCGSNARLELLRNGTVCAVIAAATPNDGAFAWTVTQCSDETDGYRIRVSDPTSGANDQSDGDFTIEEAVTPCAIAVTSPNGGEAWTEGTIHEITWNSTGDCGTDVKIELLRNGTVCSTIAATTPDDGSYSWTVAQCDDETTGYRIRVTDPTSGANDQSNTDFTIEDVVGPCEVTVISPNGGESWTEGTVHDITWSHAGDCGADVMIELLRNGAVCATIAASTPNDGIFAWTATRCGDATDLYRVRVTDLTSDAADESDGVFDIPEACAIAVTSPNGGETWTEGTVHDITWTPSGDCGANVVIELLRNGSQCATIAASTPNDGLYSWTAAQCDNEAAGYRIRVTEPTSGANDQSDADFTIEDAVVPCTIAVTSPNGGETWTEGTVHDITWTPTGDCGPNVSIELLRNGTLCATIAASEANDGSYSWTAAQCGDATDLYRIRVTDLTSSATDESDANFEIPEACAIAVTSPNGGETWTEGTVHDITWTPTGDCGSNVSIELLRNGTLCATIAASEANDGSYSWTVAQCDDETAGYRIRVTDPTSGANDQSDADFTIEDAVVPCDLTVTSPNGGESWTENTGHAITWSSSAECGPTVKIELLRNGIVCATIAESEANDGSYSWGVAQCDNATDHYKIRVTDPTSGAADESDGEFNIPDHPCQIAVTSPNGGEAWTEGTVQNITWTSTGGCWSSVRIELLLNGTLCSTISSGELNDGSYSWTVAQCGDATEHYRVRVRDVINGISDQSDGEFTIPNP